jgi:hypothetical protein
MRGLSRLFWFLVYFFQAETPALRQEAFRSAKAHYALIPLRSARNPYPRVVDYDRRRQEFITYQRAYINARCSEIAKEKLASKYGQ